MYRLYIYVSLTEETNVELYLNFEIGIRQHSNYLLHTNPEYWGGRANSPWQILHPDILLHFPKRRAKLY